MKRQKQKRLLWLEKFGSNNDKDFAPFQKQFEKQINEHSSTKEQPIAGRLTKTEITNFPHQQNYNNPHYLR